MAEIIDNFDKIEELVTAGKIDEAEEMLNQNDAIVKQQQVEHAQLFYQKGAIKEIKLKYAEAYKAFKKAVKLQPDNDKYRQAKKRLKEILRGDSEKYDNNQTHSEFDGPD